MAVLTATPLTRSGVTITGVAAGASGDQVANTGKEFFLVTNGSGGSITVTLDMTATVDGVNPTDPTVAVPAGESRMIGPFPKGLYDDASGLVKITYSATTSVTVKALQLTAVN
jgi:hypothetical protein